jgi:hypothetical protein
MKFAPGKDGSSIELKTGMPFESPVPSGKARPRIAHCHFASCGLLAAAKALRTPNFSGKAMPAPTIAEVFIKSRLVIFIVLSSFITIGWLLKNTGYLTSKA